MQSSIWHSPKLNVKPVPVCRHMGREDKEWFQVGGGRQEKCFTRALRSAADRAGSKRESAWVPTPVKAADGRGARGDGQALGLQTVGVLPHLHL